LRRDRRPESRNFAAAFAALQSVDAGPFADVVAVGRPALEEFFFEAGENRLLRAVLFPIGVGRREADIEPCFFKQAFFDGNNHRQVKHRIIRCDFYDRLRRGTHKRNLPSLAYLPYRSRSSAGLRSKNRKK